MFTVYQYSFFFFLKAEHALSSQRKTFSYTNLKQRNQYRAMFILYPTVKKEKKMFIFQNFHGVFRKNYKYVIQTVHHKKKNFGVQRNWVIIYYRYIMISECKAPDSLQIFRSAMKAIGTDLITSLINAGCIRRKI